MPGDKLPFRVSQWPAGAHPDKRFTTFHAAASYAAQRAKNFGPTTVFKGRTVLMECRHSTFSARHMAAWDKRYAKCRLSLAGRRQLKEI